MHENGDYWDHGEDSNNDTGKCFQQQVVFIHESYLNNQPSKPKTRRRRWTQKDMTNAFNAVKCTGMSLRGAASHYNVPESTLRDRVHGRVSLDCSRPGPPTFFTYEEEKKMVDHILFMSKIGYPYTRNQVVELAGDMTKAVDRIAPFKFLNPSQAWFYAFLNRWPDLKNYLYGPRSNRKSKGVSAESIQAYYDNLEKVLSKYDIKNKPEHIWMTDEVSIACDNSNVPKILPITIQRPQSNTYWNPTAAVLGAGNAAGDKIPAFLMFKASEISNEMMEGSVKGSKFATSNNGWVNADAFIQWYERHFRPLVSHRPVILLYDGHLQFVTVRVLEKAKEDNVLLFPLPPHPPYNHCMESSCFAAYPKYFNKRILKFHDDFKRNVSKSSVSKVICHAYEWALQPINLISIFFKLGICPYNNLSNNLAPYMPDNYEFQNDENVENIESDYSQYDSPMDRSYMNEEHYSSYESHQQHYGHHKYSPSISISNVHSCHNSNINSASVSASNIISTASSASNVNSSLLSVNSPSKFYSHISPNFSASNQSVKVLDNMASKAMNQIHAQRSEMGHSKIFPLSNTDQNSASYLPIKNLTRNQLIFRGGMGQSTNCVTANTTAKLSPGSQIKVIPSTDLTVHPACCKASSSVTTDSSVYISPISTSSTPLNTPIKVIKTGNNTSVIVKTSTNSTDNGNRQLVRLHSVSSVDEPLTKKPALVMSKSDEYRCYENVEQITTISNTNLINEIAVPLSRTDSSLITTPIVYDSGNLIQDASECSMNTDEPMSTTGTQQVELMEVIKPDTDDQETDEMSQTCNVCGRVEPPGLTQISGDNEELVVDWAHCDFCYKWVHLQPCCDSRCVQSDNQFKCIVCIRLDDSSVLQIPTVSKHELKDSCDQKNVSAIVTSEIMDISVENTIQTSNNVFDQDGNSVSIRSVTSSKI